MKSKAKSIIKYGIIIALLVGAGFLVKVIFFPTPKPTESYENIYSITTNETYYNIKEANDKLFSNLAIYPDALLDDISKEQKEKFINQYHTITVAYGSLDNINNIHCQALLYAENNRTYNENAKLIKKEIEKINKKMEEIQQYLDQYFTPFTSQENKTFSSISTYANAIFDYNFSFIEMYTNTLEYSLEILPSLKQDFSNNEYIQTTSKVVLSWVNLFKNNTNSIISIDDLNNCYDLSTNLNTTKSSEYFNNKENTNIILDAVNSCDLNSLLKVISDTEKYNEYFETLNEEQKENVTKAKQFILI